MLELIRTAGVFMIIAQTMYHFVSGSKYARYVRLLIRIMTLAVLIVPLLDLIKSGTKEDFQERLFQFEQEYEAIMQDAEHTDMTLVEEQIEQTTVQQLRAMVDPMLVPYGYETVFVYADEEGLLFTIRSFLGRETGEIKVQPVREISIQVGEQEEASNGERDATDSGEREGSENGGYVGQQGGQSAEISGGQLTEAELASMIAAYLRVESSWVEVRIVE